MSHKPNNKNRTYHKPPVFCLVDTETTILQKQTEQECKPFFVDLSKLSVGQRKHLQQVGLLKESIHIDNATDTDTDTDNGNDSSNDNENNPNHWVQLLRSQHRAYLEGVWRKPLKAPFVSLDSSRPWMLYWCLHAYDLLSDEPGNTNDSNNNKKWITRRDGASMVSTLEDCWQGYHTPRSKVPEILEEDDDDELYFQTHDDDDDDADDETTDNDEPRYYCGGFGGGPGQMAHAATTYAAVLSLCILATSREHDDCDDDNDDDEDDDDESDSNGDSDSDVEDRDSQQQPPQAQQAQAQAQAQPPPTPTPSSSDDEKDSYQSLHYSERAMRILREIRIPLYRWMVSLQVPETGGYRMQHDGEVDVRATYTIACCSRLLGLLTTQTKKKKNKDKNNKRHSHTVLGRPLVVDFVRSCQTYEGGIGGEPFAEAHGGYTLCAVAALKLLGALHDHQGGEEDEQQQQQHPLDVLALIGWLSRRQTSYEGGFSGRSNKLVDGCYSFWQGGAMAIASSASGAIAGDGGGNNNNNNNNNNNSNSGNDSDSDDPWLERYRESCAIATATAQPLPPSSDLPFPLLYDVFLLERYILLCAQEITGGMRDKPSKPRDFYHTCYNLSGLSIAQHYSSRHGCNNNNNNNYDGDNDTEKFDEGFGDPEQTVVGATHPLYNIRIDRVAAILDMEW